MPLFSWANQIQSSAQTFNKNIDDLKDLLGKESGGVYTQFDADAKANIDMNFYRK